MADRSASEVRERTRLTYREYRHFPDDGKRHEIIDGGHYVSPSPTSAHQAASRWIQVQLFRQIEEAGTGYAINAPMDVELTRYDIVQPDLVVVAHSRREIISPARIVGVPDLIVEILSRSTADHDTELKLALYERVGVPHYWIVDTDAREVTVRSLGSGGRYGRPVVHSDRIEFSHLEMRADVDLACVWRAL